MNTGRSFLPYLLSSPLYLAISENASLTENASVPTPMTFSVSDGNLMILFSTPFNLAQFFEKTQDFVEISPQAVLTMAQEKKIKIGFDLGQDHGVILDQDVMRTVLEYLKNREQLEELDELDLKEFQPVQSMVLEFENIVPENTEGFLIFDATKDYIFILVGESEGIDLNAVRRALFENQNLDEISFLYFPKTHPKWHEIQNEVNAKGVKIEARSEEREPKIPILRY